MRIVANAKAKPMYRLHLPPGPSCFPERPVLMDARSCLPPSGFVARDAGEMGWWRFSHRPIFLSIAFQLAFSAVAEVAPWPEESAPQLEGISTCAKNGSSLKRSPPDRAPHPGANSPWR
jgi:hypothetical protein